MAGGGGGGGKYFGVQIHVFDSRGEGVGFILTLLCLFVFPHEVLCECT